MTEPSDLSRMQTNLLHDIDARADAALMAGLDHPTVAYILRMLSSEVAMKGEPEALYKHTLLMQNEAEEMRAEFLKRFPDLDIDALMNGKIVRK